MANILELSEKAVHFIGFQSKLCCTIKVDIRNSKSQYIEKDKNDGKHVCRRAKSVAAMPV